LRQNSFKGARLWNGLLAELCPLKERADLRELVLRSGALSDRSKLIAADLDYWLIKVRLRRETVYLVIGNTFFVTRKDMEERIMLEHGEMCSRLLFVIYNKTAHFWSSTQAKIIISAVDRRMNPKILTLICQTDADKLQTLNISGAAG
jgi:hypothetical protein